ncbi:hypothetical protein RJ55_03069 [Drechmeria coniospora]|nr:hypothetical protein RJ55_03069 [Drechmeria coniospora]
MVFVAVDREASGDADADVASPKNRSSVYHVSMDMAGTGIESRADPDAHTTVSDFLDFTEYLPSDIVRSLTLIGKLDEAYADASHKVDDLTAQWGRLPSLAGEERPDPAKLRADISEQLQQAVSSRVFSHAEAVRMSENVMRHHAKAKLLLSKLQSMMEHYPAEEPKSPLVPKSPQTSRAKSSVRPTGVDGKKISRHKIPRVTVPGEVLAPYDIHYDSCTDESDISSDSESDIPAGGRRTPAPASRIKLMASKGHKQASRPSRQPFTSAAMTAAVAANAAALLNPPPEGAVVGSADAPWLQLTAYELAKLRKRMKKNATWAPSDTMVARELKNLGRGPDEYRDAKKQAAAEGRPFNPTVPIPMVDKASGVPQLPAGAMSVDALGSGDQPPTTSTSSSSSSSRGMKLNEAKRVKREALAKLAAEEAEESARKMAHAAQLFLGNGGPGNSQDARTPSGNARTGSRSNGKRKRDAEADAPEAERGETPSRPLSKRSKTETLAPPPRQSSVGQGMDGSGSGNPALLTPGSTAAVTQSVTPVPIPMPPQNQSARSAASPTSVTSNGNTITTMIPIKPPASQTPIPLPRTDQRRTMTPIPAPTRDANTRRETRGEAAKRTQQQASAPSHAAEPSIRQSSSRGPTPAPSMTPESHPGRRPSSRGAASQELPTSLATDRTRRASTARNTPAPEFKQPPKRTKRPAPGVVSTTNSGGNSAVGKRKAAPRKKARQAAETELEEVDDEGKPIDPDEPRYCLCNNVGFGTMIQCDNLEHCKEEWFHLGCVGLSDIPARTTKWYCPDCRRLLNIGERGEVSARGVRK